MDVSIYNALGVEVKAIKIDEADEAPVRIELNELSNGAYMIFIQAQGKPVGKKLVISRLY